MKSMHRHFPRRVPRLAWGMVVWALFATAPACGQLNLNGGATFAEALDGQWGIEGRIGFYPPGLPVDFFAGADYFFTDCSVDCGLWGARVGGHLHSASPGIGPFLSAAYLRRRWESGDRTRTPTGWALGAGLRLDLWRIRFQAELSREFLGGDLNQWVIRLGTG